MVEKPLNGFRESEIGPLFRPHNFTCGEYFHYQKRVRRDKVGHSLQSSALPETMESDSDSVASEPVRLEEDHEWQDAEDDIEDVTFVSLFDDRTFRHIKDMLSYCKEDFGFDTQKIQETLLLDDLEQIKLINYIRSEAKKGNKSPELSNKSAFESDKYLQPVLEDDAVL